MAFFCLTFDLAILISAITTYVYCYKTVRKIRILMATTEGQPQAGGLHLLFNKFKQPCYIVVTYICFNLTSSIIQTSVNYIKDTKQEEILFIFFDVLLLVGFSSDAFIYVFSNKNVQNCYVLS